MAMKGRRHDGVTAWGGRCRAVMLLCLGLVALAPAAAQQPAARPWPVDVAHYAKWPGLVATGTMLALGFMAERDAAKWRDSLAGSNPGAAAEYESARGRARTWILGGEIALIGTGAMFLIDLIHGDEGPPNVPFTPFTVYSAPGRIGLSIRRR